MMLALLAMVCSVAAAAEDRNVESSCFVAISDPGNSVDRSGNRFTFDLKQQHSCGDSHPIKPDNGWL